MKKKFLNYIFFWLNFFELPPNFRFSKIYLVMKKKFFFWGASFFKHPNMKTKKKFFPKAKNSKNYSKIKSNSKHESRKKNISNTDINFSHHYNLPNVLTLGLDRLVSLNLALYSISVNLFSTF